jgi:hypothetical protein
MLARFAPRYLFLTLVASSGVAAIAACTAAGGGDPVTELEAGATEPPPTVSLPPPSDEIEDGGPSDARTDAKKNDGGKDAASKDAAADVWAPDPGEDCPVIDQIIKRTCGLCGSQEAVCLVNDGGPIGVVSPYSPCTNEVDGGCNPGSTAIEACGNCGTHTRVCNKSCMWQPGVCQGQPVDSCTPSVSDYTTAGCLDGGTRARKCKDTCTWTDFSLTCHPLDFELVAAATAGAEVSGIYPLRASLTDKRLTGSCTSGYLSTTTTHPYVYVELVNPSDKTLTVSVWNTQAPNNGPLIDTLMAAYPGSARPTTDDQRKACQKGIGDYCPTGLPCGSTQWAGLTGATAVTIPAGGSTLIWFGTYSTAGGGATVEGNVKLVVRTDTVQ